MAPGNPLWFDDVPPWPASGTTPVAQLATRVAEVRALVAAPPPTPARRPDDAPRPPAPGPVTAPPHPEPQPPSVVLPSPVSPHPDEPHAPADDDHWTAMVPAAPTASRWPRKPILIGAAAVIVLLAAVGIGVALGSGGDGPAPEAAPPPISRPVVPAASSIPGGDCPTTTNGKVTTGRDKGDQTSGPNVIKRFNYAYYVERSASLARSVTTPNAVATEASLQSWIDKRELGTTHCLRITDRGNGRYAVELVETEPGFNPQTFRQLITTTRSRGLVWIAKIEDVD